MIGYRYIRTSKVDWRVHQGALIPLTMAHAVSLPSFLELLRLLFRYQALFIRWEERFDSLEDSSWWHIIKSEDENIELLSKNTRSKVRRGHRRFVSSLSSRREIFDEGFDVYSTAFDRYKTFEPMLSLTEFQKAINALPAETEFWAVREISTNQLVAFSENLVRDNACFYNTIWFKPEALRSYAGYIMFFEMNKYYLNHCRVKYVSDGTRSISHQTNIHEFLQEKFGFRKAYSLLRIRYFPGIGLIINLIYPFRRLFENRSLGVFQKISVLLRQESIRRSCLAIGRKI